MTEKDKELMSRASERDWVKTMHMVAEAESEEAKEMLRDIAVRGYHMEEASARMI